MNPYIKDRLDDGTMSNAVEISDELEILGFEVAWLVDGEEITLRIRRKRYPQFFQEDVKYGIRRPKPWAVRFREYRRR